MKIMKKSVSVMVIVMMLMMVGVPAFAADGDFTSNGDASQTVVDYFTNQANDTTEIVVLLKDTEGYTVDDSTVTVTIYDDGTELGTATYDSFTKLIEAGYVYEATGNTVEDGSVITVDVDGDSNPDGNSVTVDYSDIDHKAWDIEVLEPSASGDPKPTVEVGQEVTFVIDVDDFDYTDLAGATIDVFDQDAGTTIGTMTDNGDGTYSLTHQFSTTGTKYLDFKTAGRTFGGSNEAVEVVEATTTTSADINVLAEPTTIDVSITATADVIWDPDTKSSTGTKIELTNNTTAPVEVSWNGLSVDTGNSWIPTIVRPDTISFDWGLSESLAQAAFGINMESADMSDLQNEGEYTDFSTMTSVDAYYGDGTTNSNLILQGDVTNDAEDTDGLTIGTVQAEGGTIGVTPIMKAGTAFDGQATTSLNTDFLIELAQ